MPLTWFWISLIAFGCATLLLVCSGFMLARVLSQILPMIDETRNQVQDLGDLAAATVGHASDTMDILESRVIQTMGQAEVSGKAAASQALGVGTAITGIYLLTKVVVAIRGMIHTKQPTQKRRSNSWWPRKKA